jgi:hypothetical protein
MERSIPESIPRVPIPVNHLHASQVGAWFLQSKRYQTSSNSASGNLSTYPVGTRESSVFEAQQLHGSESMCWPLTHRVRSLLAVQKWHKLRWPREILKDSAASQKRTMFRTVINNSFLDPVPYRSFQETYELSVCWLTKTKSFQTVTVCFTRPGHWIKAKAEKSDLLEKASGKWLHGVAL